MFVGYFMVTPWNHYYDGMNDEYLSLGEDYFVQSASISLSLVNRVEIGMTVERVISILGSVGTVIGNEYPISIYECADGSVVTISYNYNVEQKTFVVSEISDRSIV